VKTNLLIDFDIMVPRVDATFLHFCITRQIWRKRHCIFFIHTWWSSWG